MGFYIEANPLKGNHKGKAAYLRVNYGALDVIKQDLINADPPEGMIPICVIHNGNWEAVGIGFDRTELEVFLDSKDNRPKSFLILPEILVIALNPQVKNYLKW